MGACFLQKGRRGTLLLFCCWMQFIPTLCPGQILKARRQIGDRHLSSFLYEIVTSHRHSHFSVLAILDV